jgi:hypothetical protein
MFRNGKNAKLLDFHYLQVGIAPIKVVSFRVCSGTITSATAEE